MYETMDKSDLWSAEEFARKLETVFRYMEAHWKCRDCETEECVTLDSDPYAHDIYDDDTPVLMCESCRHEAAMDI